MDKATYANSIWRIGGVAKMCIDEQSKININVLKKADLSQLAALVQKALTLFGLADKPGVVETFSNSLIA